MRPPVAPSGMPRGGKPSAEAAFKAGLALQEAGRLQEAANAYRAAVTTKPDFAGAFCNLGVVLKKLGRANEALAAYQRAVELEPDFFEAQYNFSILLGLVGRHSAAIEGYRRAIALRPDLAAVHCNLGKALQEEGQSDLARAAYREALRLQPNHLPALSNLAAALISAREAEEALVVAKRALALVEGVLGENKASKKDAAPALALCAKAALLCGQDEAALVFAQRAQQADPGAFESVELLAKMLRNLGRDDDVLALYRAVLAKRPGQAEVSARLADLHLTAGKAAEALAVSEDSLRHCPGNTRAIAAKAAALTALGRLMDLDRLLDMDRLVSAQKIGSMPGFSTMAAFKAAMIEHILQHPSLKKNPAGLATRAGRQTGELLIEPKGPIAAFEKRLVEAVVDYARTHPVSQETPFLAAQPSRWRLNIWATILGASGYQEPHLHPSGWLSGVFYLAVPPQIAAGDNSQRGWIEFGRPPQLPEGAAVPRLKTVAPEEGLMLLFPSYLHHRTIPTGQEALRISIAFDVVPHD